MKKYIIPFLLLILAILSSYNVYTKINITNYNKNKLDESFMKMFKGTELVLNESLEDEEKNWGKNDNSSDSKLYLKYGKCNLDEMANYLKNRDEDKFNIKASLLLDDLYDLYNLNNLIGHNQIEFKTKYNKIQKELKLHKTELEKVVK